MKKIILMGELGEKFGKEHSFDVKTVSEGIRALRANFRDFEGYMIKSSDRGVGYRLHVASSPVIEDEELLHPLGKREEIIIAPAIMGSSGTAKIIAGVVLIAIGAVITAYGGGVVGGPIIGLGVSLIVGGVVQLLTPLPKVASPFEKKDAAPSYYFTGPVNTSAQGQPVAMLYGEMTVGSAVISAGITIQEAV